MTKIQVVTSLLDGADQRLAAQCLLGMDRKRPDRQAYQQDQKKELSVAAVHNAPRFAVIKNLLNQNHADQSPKNGLTGSKNLGFAGTQ